MNLKGMLLDRARNPYAFEDSCRDTLEEFSTALKDVLVGPYEATLGGDALEVLGEDDLWTPTLRITLEGGYDGYSKNAYHPILTIWYRRLSDRGNLVSTLETILIYSLDQLRSTLVNAIPAYMLTKEHKSPKRRVES